VFHFIIKEFQMPQAHPNGKDFSLAITVSKNDIDELGHVNNVVYVRWVQEAAAAHWDSLASSEIKQKYVWVVLRHEIDYLSAAFENDTITATTWVGDSKGARSERFVHIANTKTGKLIAKAKTTWCMLDGATMRPKRVDEEVVRLLRG
jgi:acyl-CoA thioester hydrolase